MMYYILYVCQSWFVFVVWTAVSSSSSKEMFLVFVNENNLFCALVGVGQHLLYRPESLRLCLILQRHKAAREKGSTVSRSNLRIPEKVQNLRTTSF